MNTWIARWQPSSVSRGSSDHRRGSESFSSAATRGPARLVRSVRAPGPGLAMNLSGASLCLAPGATGGSPALQWSQPPANLEPPWQWPALGWQTETQAEPESRYWRERAGPQWRQHQHLHCLPGCTLNHPVLYFGLEFLLSNK